MAAATKLYLFWAGTTGNVPAGWSYESGFDNKFIRGSNTYGGTGGSNIHTHTVSSPSCNPTSATHMALAPGINVADMSTQPRDHTDSKEMSARTDQELFKVIKDGGQSINKSVLMPPWSSTLLDEEIESLVKYLHELCKC